LSQLKEFYKEILSDFISAYRKHYSCKTSLLRVVEDWRASLDNKKIVAVVSMDLSKAFDTIPYALSLAKLKAHGLGDSACALLEDYLSSRKQRVKVGDTYSNWETVERGIPQSNVLGPPMFLIICINDLFYHIKMVKLNAFVDDKQLYNSDIDPVALEMHIQHDVNIVNMQVVPRQWNDC